MLLQGQKLVIYLYSDGQKTEEQQWLCTVELSERLVWGSDSSMGGVWKPHKEMTAHLDDLLGQAHPRHAV